MHKTISMSLQGMGRHMETQGCMVQGAWWLAGEQGPSAGVGQGAAMSQALAQAAAGAQGTDLLQLAAAQRFATDVQRAAFCCIMGSSDAAQATERLLRLPLKAGALSCVTRALHTASHAWRANCCVWYSVSCILAGMI